MKPMNDCSKTCVFIEETEMSEKKSTVKDRGFGLDYLTFPILGNLHCCTFYSEKKPLSH